MFRTRQRLLSGLGLLRVLCLACCTFSCATGPTAPSQPESVRSHLYPLPLDNVLGQAMPLLEKKGWQVKRVGNVLVTNWQGTVTTALVTYRVYGERIDAGLSSIRIEKVVATPAQFILQHPVTGINKYQRPAPDLPAEFAVNPADDDVGSSVPQQVVITVRERDAAMELEFQEQIDPLSVAVTEQPDAGGVASVMGVITPPQPMTPAPAVGGDAGVAEGPQSSAERLVNALGGVWEGTFNFRGSVIGSYAGEVVVAVSDTSAEVTDFCPERGGAITATGSRDFASWQGELSCPPIPVQGCTNAVIKYNFAHLVLNGTKLTVVGAGNVDLPAGCRSQSGTAELSVTFVAEKAHYLYLAVRRTKEKATCEWPADWEDLGSPGSMPMPDPEANASAYLGIIRAKGARLADIDLLLRHCRHRVLLHGGPVSMQLAVMGQRGGLR
jgi:hypothetical protein